MQREPSIHITESNLIKVIDEVMEFMQDENPNEFDTPLIVRTILERAKKYQLSNRKLLGTNKKLAQKANIIAKSPLEDAMIMAKVIYMVRKDLKHRGIEIAKPNSRDFTIIKTIASHAEDYRQHHGAAKLTKTQVYTSYIRIFFRLIDKGKFNLIRLQNSYEAIIEFEEAESLLFDDPNKRITSRAYERYNQLVIKQVGSLLVEYNKIPDKYKFFVEVAKICVRLKIAPEPYIDSQFEGLAWTKGIPEPIQLIGPKAMERLQKYLFAKGTQTNEPEVSVENIKSLKNLKKLK